MRILGSGVWGLGSGVWGLGSAKNPWDLGVRGGEPCRASVLNAVGVMRGCSQDLGNRWRRRAYIYK